MADQSKRHGAGQCAGVAIRCALDGRVGRCRKPVPMRSERLCPEAVISGLIRMLPSWDWGPRLLKPAMLSVPIKSALPDCVRGLVERRVDCHRGTRRAQVTLLLPFGYQRLLELPPSICSRRRLYTPFRDPGNPHDVNGNIGRLSRDRPGLVHRRQGKLQEKISMHSMYRAGSPVPSSSSYGMLIHVLRRAAMPI